MKPQNFVKNFGSRKFFLNFLGNKKAASIPIFLLVLSTLVLVGVSLGYFYISKEKNKETIQIYHSIDEIYIQEALLNYHLQYIFDNSVKNFKFEQREEIFINNFKNELKKYKDENGNYLIENLKQIENQINEENVELINKLDEKKLILRLDIKLKKNQKTKDKIDVDYSYLKRFEKIFK